MLRKLNVLIVLFLIKITFFHHLLIYFANLIFQVLFFFNLIYNLYHIVITFIILFSPNCLHYCNWDAMFLMLYYVLKIY